MPVLPQKVLADLQRSFHSLYGKRLERLVLYGSYARGTVHPESDVDVMVVLQGPVDPVAEIRRMSDIRMDLGLRYERCISTMPVAAQTYAEARTGLLRNVQLEGVVL